MIYQIGQIYSEKLNRDDLAIRAYQDLLIEYPNAYEADDAQFALAKSYAKLNDNQKAIKEYERLINEYPSSQLIPEAKRQIDYIGNYLVKDYESATNELYAIINKMLNGQLDAKTYFLLGEIYNEKLKDYQKSAEAYEGFLRVYPDDNLADDAQFKIGESYRKLASKAEFEKDNWNASNYSNQALQAYRKLVAYYPASEYTPKAELRIIESEVASFGGGYYQKYSLMLEKYQNFLVQYPNTEYNDWVYFKIGDAYRNLQNYSEAIANYQIVTTNYPNSDWADDASFNVGYCYEEMGDYLQAKSAYKKTVRNYPNGDSTYKAYF